jgi:hypothetical protein
VLGERDELRGRNEPSLRMGPAEKGLRPHHGARLEVDLGLIVEAELVRLQGLAELAEEGEPLGIVRLVLFGVEETGSPSELLRLLDRRVGPAQQDLRLLAVLRRDRDPDARSDLDGQAGQVLEHERLLQGGEHALPDLDREGPVGVRQQHSELVAAQASDALFVAQDVAEPVGQVSYDEVAVVGTEGCHRIAEAVVVEGQDEEREGSTRAGPLRQSPP